MLLLELFVREPPLSNHATGVPPGMSHVGRTRGRSCLYVDEERAAAGELELGELSSVTRRRLERVCACTPPWSRSLEEVDRGSRVFELLELREDVAGVSMLEDVEAEDVAVLPVSWRRFRRLLFRRRWTASG